MILGTFFFESICWEKWNTFWSQPEQNKHNFELPSPSFYFQLSVSAYIIKELSKQCNTMFILRLQYRFIDERKEDFRMSKSVRHLLSTPRSPPRCPGPWWSSPGPWSRAARTRGPRSAGPWVVFDNFDINVLLCLHNIWKRPLPYLKVSMWAFKGE